MANTVYSLQVVPRLPAALGRLDDLAENLWFSWRPRVRELFAHLDPDLWLKVEANPKLFLRCLHPDILERAATSEAFLENYHQLLGEFDDYLANRAPIFRTEGLEDSDLIAYFSAEYGFHAARRIHLQDALHVPRHLLGVDVRRQSQAQLKRGQRSQHIARVLDRRQTVGTDHRQERPPSAIENSL